jgi:uncharacterized protein (TIGR03000 family)
MFRPFSSLLGISTLAAVTLFLGPQASLAQRGGRGGGGGAYRGGAAHAGAYRGGAYYGGAYHGGYYGTARPYGYGYGPYHGYYGPYHGYYRPYYGYYRPYYGFGFFAFSYGGYGYFMPYYASYPAPVYAAYPAPVVGSPGSAPPTAAAPAAENAPPRDDAAHLQLIVPENAEVYFDGTKTTQTGRVREFTSPALALGKRFTYQISVRYTDSTGRPVDDTRPIHVGANDWFTVDFTRPAPPERVPVPSPVLPKTPAGK